MMPRRVYMWIPPGGSNCRTSHIMPQGEKECPKTIWTMLRYEHPSRPPPPDLPLRHGQTAFLEDILHDWNWSATRPNELRYYSRVTKGGTWIALLFQGEDDTSPKRCNTCKIPVPGGRFCPLCGKKLQ